MDQSHYEEVASFIRELRSNESNYQKIYAKLEEEAANNQTIPSYQSALNEIKEKGAAEYSKAKESGGTAWPEFEKFVSEFEKAVTEAIKEAT